MTEPYCPFVKGPCRPDCIFRMDPAMTQDGTIQKCLIVSKLKAINELQHDDLDEIKDLLRKRLDRP